MRQAQSATVRLRVQPEPPPAKAGRFQHVAPRCDRRSGYRLGTEGFRP
jgi:hypothetical protein